MNEMSSVICVTRGSAWIGREPDGSMTGGTFTDYKVRTGSHSSSNVRITRRWTSQDGLQNYTANVLMRLLLLVLSSTRSEVRRGALTSTPLCHSGCSCISLEKRDTADA